MLADIEDPPRSRASGLVLGLLMAVPVAASFFFWVLPWLASSVLGGAKEFDEKLRAQDAYMKRVCVEAMDLERDEALCQCALAVDYPALDCQGPFRRWAVERQAERCGDEETAKEHVSYCTCTQTLAEAVAAAPPEEADAAARHYDRCEALPDAFDLPAVEALGPSS